MPKLAFRHVGTDSPLPETAWALGKQFIGKYLFAECTLSGIAECQSDTRQRKVIVTASATVTAALPSAKVKRSAKVLALPSVVDLDTRQRWSLCRVPPARHSAKYVMFAECLSRGTR